MSQTEQDNGPQRLIAIRARYAIKGGCAVLDNVSCDLGVIEEVIGE